MTKHAIIYSDGTVLQFEVVEGSSAAQLLERAEEANRTSTVFSGLGGLAVMVSGATLALAYCVFGRSACPRTANLFTGLFVGWCALGSYVGLTSVHLYNKHRQLWDQAKCIVPGLR